jgi:hypothetical protein
MDKQKAFDAVVKQGLGAATSERTADAVAQDAKVRGAAPAIAEAVDKILEGVVMAARNSGVDLPSDVVKASAETMVMAMSAMMAQAGGAKDAESLAAEVMSILAQEDEQAEEQPEQAEPPQAAPGAPGALGAVRSGGVM